MTLPNTAINPVGLRRSLTSDHVKKLIEIYTCDSCTSLPVLSPIVSG